MKIQVVGPGCPRCNQTEQNVVNACAELELNADFEHVRDVTRFAQLGVIFTPGVVIDGEVVFSGRIPSVDEIKSALSDPARR